MKKLISERLKQLREEIAQIQAANSSQEKYGSIQEREAMQQRRAQRLQEIKDELLALTDWKKP
jgi:hypothetical protein